MTALKDRFDSSNGGYFDREQRECPQEFDREGDPVDLVFADADDFEPFQ